LGTGFGRPTERERDIRDIGELLKRYELENDERRFTDEIIQRQIAYDSAGAFLLGIDVGRICSNTEQHVTEVFVAELNDETTHLLIPTQ
jgi:predicted nucleotidyltransferase